MQEIIDPPIIEATLQGNLPEVKRLVAQGGNLDIKSIEKLTALRYAIERRYPEIALELIAAGANVNLVDRQGTTMVMAAIMHKQYKVMEALIIAGADVLTRTISSHVHALGTAAIFGSSETIYKLVSLGASIQEDGQMALLNALSFDNLETAKALVDLGAILYADEEEKYEFLRVAIVKGSVKMIILLLQDGIWNDLSEKYREKILESAEEWDTSWILDNFLHKFS